MIKVLYIEDDTAHVELTNRSLESSDIRFNLQTAPTIAEAFELLLGNEYDVILSDYRLPDGSGLDVINRAVQKNLSAAIVLITNQEDINVAITALKAGAVDYVVKQSDYLHKLPIVLNNAYRQSQLDKQKKALLDAENKYRNIFENAVEGIFQSTLEGRFINVNPEMARIYGYTSPDDMLANVTSISEQIHSSVDSRKKLIDSLVAQGFVENYEAQNLRKDGEPIWTSINARLVKDDLDNTLYIEGFLKDITERKQAELARQESEKKYKSLIERFPGVVFLDDFNNEEISQYISPRIEDLLGYTQDEWMNGKNLWENSLHPDDQNRILAEDKRTNETGEPFQVEYRLRKKDGSYVWVREDAYLIHDQSGTPVFWQGILLDISSQKQAQEAIKASEGSYRGLFNSVSQAIYIQDRSGRFLDVNHGASIMYGYPREFFIGKSPDILGAPNMNDMKNLSRSLELAFSGVPQEFEFWGMRNNGQIFPKIVSLTKGTYFGQDVVIAFAQDITERKNAEKVLERQLKALTVLHATSVAGVQSNSEDEIIEQVSRITANIYSEVCGILLLNEKKDILIPHPSYRGADIKNWEDGYPITEGITGRSVLTGKSIRINDVTKDPGYIQIAGGIRSELCVPFWVHNHIIGVFNVESRQPSAFDDEDERLLNTIAGGLGTAIEKLRLFEAEQHRRKQAEILHKATETLTTSIELDKLFEIIFDSLMELVTYDSASIELITPDGYYEIVAGRNVSNNVIGKKYKTDPEKWDGVDKLHQPVLITDVQADDRFEKFEGSEYIRSWMGIPLFSQGVLLGCLNLDSRAPGFFNKEHVALAQTFANQAGIAIENARLLQEKSHRSQIIEALAEIANEIATIQEIIPALNKIAKRTLTLLNATSVAFYLLQDDKETIKIVSAKGAYQKELLSHTIKLGEGITGNVIANGKPEIVDEVAKDARRVNVPGTPEKESSPDTMMSAPLILHGEAIGAINVWRLKSNGPFDKAELNFLVSIAHQASISIESGNLFQESIRRAQEAAAIAEVGRDISATLQLDIVLERIAMYAKILLKAETSAVYLSDPDNSHLHAIAAIGAESEEIKSDPIQTGVGILGSIALQKSGEIVNNTMNDPRAIIIKGTKMEVNEHIMGASVLSKDNLTGLLVVWRNGVEKEFKVTELGFLSSLAQQAAVAIENARLFEAERRRRQEAESLRAAATAITSSLDPKTVLETILTTLQEVVSFDSGTMMLLEDDYVRIVAAQGFDNNDLILNRTYPANNKLLVVINQLKKPYIVDDVTKDGRFEKWASDKPIRAWMGIPLIAHDNIIGYITLDSFKVGAFDSNAATLANTFALHATAAIENTKLFENLQISNQELSLAYDTTLVGWAKALELRDKETHGHTNRVTDLTMDLARFIGLSKTDLITLRRGVLLHDIGKMGVPDEILHKKGPLTKEEWVEMRKHPQYAFDLLYPISFLRPSLDIPYSHHEWWDGTGYPQKLKGEEIPLAARIFAIVDVWDALLSDRPYRKAWTKTKAARYLLDHAGSHFDPKLVMIFLNMMDIQVQKKPEDKRKGKQAAIPAKSPRKKK
ncbi:MAG: GAF domain-containing protein [Chloroflexi bacterium]|nr:GAF domain-containing protein [Chloroflexota bacterium]